MSKLEDKQMSMLKLIGRSPPDAEGWCRVSSVCCTLFDRPKDLPPSELFKFERLDGDTGRVKLTERGEILLAYS